MDERSIDVLIVDDDTGIRQLLKAYLEQHGYRAYPLVDHVADKITAIIQRYGELAMPSKQRLRTDQECRPPSSGEVPAERGHEHPVPATEARLAQLPSENHQLVAQDHDLKLSLMTAADEHANKPAQDPIQHTRQHEAQSEPLRPRSPAQPFRPNRVSLHHT